MQCDKKRDISDSRKIFMESISKNVASVTPLAAGNGSGTLSAPDTEPGATVTPSATVTYRLYMPITYEAREHTVFEVTRAIHSGLKIDQMEQELAFEIINSMAEELNIKYMTGLGAVSAQLAEEEDGEPPSYPRLIFVGGSHAARMAAAADNLGFDVVNLSTPGFRVTESNVENSAEMLEDALSDNTVKSVVIYQLLDNNVFFETREDGSRSLPTKSQEDGCYHIRGKLDYADHGVIKSLINTATPLLRAGGESEKIILSPLPRYMRRCCKDRDHLTNKKDSDYAAKMGEALAEMRDSMKDLIYGKRIRNFKVLSTTMLFMSDTETAAEKLRSFWDEAVHMTPEGYTELVEEVVKVITTATFTRPPTEAQLGNSGRGRKRKQWVSADDTLAHRRYGDDLRDGGKRFRGGGRGGGRSRGRGRGGPRGGSRGGRGGGPSGAAVNKGWVHHGGRGHNRGGRGRYNKY
jgi:hypothetical protein